MSFPDNLGPPRSDFSTTHAKFPREKHETPPVPITRNTHLLDLTVALLLLRAAKLVAVTRDPESEPGRNRYRFTLEISDSHDLNLYDAWTAYRDPRFSHLTLPLSIASRLSLGSRVAIQWLSSGTLHPHKDIVPEVWEALTKVPRPTTPEML